MKAPISPSHKTSIIAQCAALLIAALALSYLEVLIPLTSIIPIPGFKPGLANIAIIIAFFKISPFYALFISMTKCVLTSLLFTGITSFMFSLSGAVLSFIILLIFSLVFRDKIGFIGISVIMALFHNVGQLICAGFLMHTKAVVYYFPILAAAALICGTLTGIILSAVPNKIYSQKESIK